MSLFALLATIVLSLGQLSAPASEATFVVSGPAEVLQRVGAWRQLPGRTAEPIALSTAPGASPRSITARVPCVAADYIFYGAGHVSLPVRLEPGACEAAGTVALLPSATVRGQIALPASTSRGAQSPRGEADSAASKTAVILPMRECSNTGRGDLLGEQRVEADEQGRFAILVPAGCVAVGIRVGRLAPVPAAPLFLSPGQVCDLGVVEMKRGATVVATVTMREAPATGVGTLAVPAAGVESAASVLLARGTWAEALGGAVSNSTGRVALVGLTASPVHLVAGAEGRVAVSTRVEFDDGDEVEAEALELRAPGRVEFAFAGDRTWIEDRFRVTGTFVAGEQGTPGMTLDCFAGEVPTTVAVPGRWQFELRAAGLLLDTQIAEIAPDTTTSVQLSVERARFRGRVYVGNRPAAGSLLLSHAATRETAARAQTGIDGRFTVLLREPGTYLASFTSEAWGVSGSTVTAQLSVDEESYIRFPASELTGQVSFADGRPAANAVVTVERGSKWVGDDAVVFGDAAPTARADASGRFVVRALEPGAYNVTARLGTRKTDARRVAVCEEGAQHVDLVIPDNDGLTVSVASRTGEPVAGLTGILLAASADSAPQPASFQTDVDGLAKVAVAWTPGSRVQVILADPKYPVAAFRVVTPPDGTLAIPLPAAAGEVRIVLPTGPQQHDSLDIETMVLVGEREAVVPVGLLTEMGLAHIVPTRSATTIVVRAIASGSWQVGRFADVASMMQAFNTGASPSLLRSFSVPPGGAATVSVSRH